MTKNFDSYLKILLNEYTPASLMDTLGGTSDKISKKIEELPGKSQHWSPLQTLSPEARKHIINNIIKYVFEDNDENTYSSSINNDEDLKAAISLALRKTAAENPEFKATGKWAVKFLTDRLANKELLGNVKYTNDDGEEIKTDKKVTQTEVKNALKRAIENTGSEDDLDELDSTGEIEIPEETPKRNAIFNPRSEFYLKRYEQIPAGTLKGDALAVYERVSGLAGEVLTGKDFLKFFERYNLGVKDLQNLLNHGILEFADSDVEGGDDFGLDMSEEDYIEDLTKHARRDFENSGFNDRHGIDFG
jgi:hypothetical protein